MSRTERCRQKEKSLNKLALDDKFCRHAKTCGIAMVTILKIMAHFKAASICSSFLMSVLNPFCVRHRRVTCSVQAGLRND